MMKVSNAEGATLGPLIISRRNTAINQLAGGGDLAAHTTQTDSYNHCHSAYNVSVAHDKY